MSYSYEDRMLRVIAHIHDNPAGDLSLDALADVAAMSRFHWHRVFRGMTGETCAQAVRRCRMNRAGAWLVQTDWPVPEIAARCGYPNLASFSRTFADAYGIPPAAFRTRGALVPPLQTPAKGDRTMFPVEIETQPARRLAAVPHKGSYFGIAKSFEQISSIFAARDLWSQARGMVGVYYDDPDAVDEAELRSHAGIIIPDTLEVEAPLETLDLPEGRYAVMHHTGPYSDLPAAYRYLYGEWLPKSGHEPGEQAPIEVYLNSPMDTAPSDLRTDVCVSLK